MNRKERFEVVDALLVCGDQNSEGATFYPSVEDISRRTGETITAVIRHMTNYGCPSRKSLHKVSGKYECPEMFLQGKKLAEWVKAQVSSSGKRPRGSQWKHKIPPPPAGEPKHSSDKEPPAISDETVPPFGHDIDPNAEPYDRDEPIGSYEKTATEMAEEYGEADVPMVTRDGIEKRKGKPLAADEFCFNWDDIDRLLVMGEIIVNASGATETHYPTRRELSRRFDVPLASLDEYIKRHNTNERRKKALVRIAIRAEEKTIERRAESIVVSREEVTKMVDEYLLEFQKALRERRMRFDSVGDFTSMVKLREYLQGGAESRVEIQGALSLSAIQERHETYRKVEDSTKAIVHVTSPQAVLDVEIVGDEEAELPADTAAESASDSNMLEVAGDTEELQRSEVGV